MVNRKNPRDELTEQEELFCKAFYANGFLNATAAAIEVGYDKKTARQTACNLRRKKRVMEYIEELKAPKIAEFDLSHDRIIKEIARVAFASIGDFIKVEENGSVTIDLNVEDKSKLAALSSVTINELPPMKITVSGEELEREVLNTNIKMLDKLKALEMLIRYKEEGTQDPSNDLDKPGPISGQILMDSARRIAFVLSMADKAIRAEEEGKKK